MEIHPPHGSIHSWKDLLIQLGTITAGIIIALSFEGVREWRHERALVHEARENIRRELSDNRKEVDDEIRNMDARGKKLDTALRFATEMLRDKRTEVRQLELEVSFPTLSAASWQTAERTGAFAHMDYAEVQKYARIYGMQDLLTAQHRSALGAVAAALGIIAASEDGDPNKAPPAELERFRQHLVTLRSILFVEEQMARRAGEIYKQTLE